MRSHGLWVVLAMWLILSSKNFLLASLTCLLNSFWSSARRVCQYCLIALAQAVFHQDLDLVEISECFALVSHASLRVCANASDISSNALTDVSPLVSMDSMCALTSSK